MLQDKTATRGPFLKSCKVSVSSKTFEKIFEAEKFAIGEQYNWIDKSVLSSMPHFFKQFHTGTLLAFPHTLLSFERGTWILFIKLTNFFSKKFTFLRSEDLFS